jgi:hypothetical protein
MSRTSKKTQYIDEVKRLYIENLKSLSEISQLLGPSVQTLSRWLGEEGIELAARPRNPNAGRSEAEQQEINERIAVRQRERIESGGHHGGRPRSIERETRECENPACSATFEVPVNSPQRFCGMTCARSVTNKEIWAEKRQMTTCPCGEMFYSPYPKKYCSDECRDVYGLKRQADPAKYMTFTCLNCQEEVTIRRSYASAKKYCSNECAAKHTKTRKFYAIEDLDVIFESGFECLFWGICSIWKIPVERADRSKAQDVNGSGWYCPDFYLPGLDIWVEVKGFEDEDDRMRYSAWRWPGRKLAVLRREELHVLMTRANDSEVREQLRTWAS